MTRLGARSPLPAAYRLGLLLLVLLGAGLRLFRMDSQSLWLDEAFSLWVARHDIATMMAWLVHIDHHPPLYYLLLRGWIQVVGSSEWALRSLSAGCGVATIPLLFQMGRSVGGMRVGALAALLVTLAPFHLYYGQEARMYALLALLAGGAVTLYCKLLFGEKQGRGRSGWVVAGALQGAAMLTHNSAAVLLPLALNGGVVSRWLWQRVRNPSEVGLEGNVPLQRWLLSQLTALVLWSGWAGPFIWQAQVVDARFWVQPVSWEVLWQTAQNFNFAHLPTSFPGPPWWNLLYWLAALSGLLWLRRSPTARWLLVALMVLPLLVALLVSIRRPIFLEQTFIWITLPYYVVIAAGWVRWAEVTTGQWPRVARLMVFLLLLPLFAGLYGTYFKVKKEPWREVAALVAEQSQPGTLILFNAGWVELPFRYYFDSYSLSAELRGVPVDLFTRGELEPQMRVSDLPELEALVRGREEVWLVYSHNWYTDPDQIIPAALEQWLVEEASYRWHGIMVQRYRGR
jgi:mannosyltransferase